MWQKWLRRVLCALGAASLLLTALTTVNYTNGIETIRGVRMGIHEVAVQAPGGEEPPVVVQVNLSSTTSRPYRVVSLNYATLKLDEQNAASCGRQKISVNVPATGVVTLSLRLEPAGSYPTTHALAEALNGNPQLSLSAQMVMEVPKRRGPVIVAVRTHGDMKQDE